MWMALISGYEDTIGFGETEEKAKEICKKLFISQSDEEWSRFYNASDIESMDWETINENFGCDCFEIKANHGYVRWIHFDETGKRIGFESENI